MLGDEWERWDGNLDSYEQEINEDKGRFLRFSTALVVSFLILSFFFLYLVYPRLISWGHQIGKSFVLLHIVFVSGFAIWYILFVVSVVYERNFLFLSGWAQPFLKLSIPFVQRLAKRMGVSRDRIGNSYVKVNNGLIRALGSKAVRERILILLPRCLSKNLITRIKSFSQVYGCSVSVAGGGEFALDLIEIYKPTSVVGIACERELLINIKEVQEGIRVLGIPNSRPFGPCKNSVVNLNDVRDAVFFLLGIKGGKKFETIFEPMPVS